MMLRTFVIAVALTAGGLAPLAAQSRATTDTALASMVAAERAFSRHSATVNTQSAFLAYMAQNALLYRPRVVRAHDFLRARPTPPDLLLLWEPVFADMSAAGDLGYTTGPWIASSRSQRTAQPTFGQYVTLWRRQQDGSWKAEIDGGIAHGPDPVGPTGVETAPVPDWRGGGTRAAAEAGLLAADSAFAVSAKDDVAAAFQRRGTAHMRLLRTGRFPLTADSAISYLRATSGYTWKPAAAAVSSSGDLGYTHGVYSIPATQRGRANESGDYLRIWRRDSSGDWRVALDLTSPAQ